MDSGPDTILTGRTSEPALPIIANSTASGSERPTVGSSRSASARRVASLSLLGICGMAGVVLGVENFLSRDIPRLGPEKYLAVVIDAPFGSVTVKEGATSNNVATIQSFDEGGQKPHFEYKLKNGIFGLLRIGIGTDEGQLQLPPLAVWHASSGLSLAGAGLVQSDRGMERRNGSIVREFHAPVPVTPFYFESTDAGNIVTVSSMHGAESKIFLSKDLPLNLQADMGFGESFIDLTDLPVMNMNVESGTNQTTITSRSPNPREMKSCSISAGLGQCSVSGIGNLNPEHFRFDGGFGSYHLSFDGTLRRDLTADIQVGLGKCSITVPPSTARVQVFYDDGLLSSYDFSGLTRRGEGYATSVGFDRSKAPILTLRLGTGMGKIAVSYH